LPIRFKSAKVIEARHIEQLERCAKTLDPPRIAALRQQIPSIDRISPELAGGAEIVWRHTCNRSGISSLVELKQLAMTPHIGTVVRDIDRDVAHHANAQLMTTALQLLPLLKKNELPELVGFQLRRKLPTDLVDSLRITLAKLRVPLFPLDLPVLMLARHKQGKVIEPRGILASKAFELLLLRPVAMRE